jgi:SAM-dependent methyltransferase
MDENIDIGTVAGFADEWTRFDQSHLTGEESKLLFEKYFRIFPWHLLPRDAVGFDAGCGTGRWAVHVAQRVGQLNCVDASADVISVARRNLSDLTNCLFHEASIGNMPLSEASMDFGYSLGVLHHMPDTAAGIRACVSKLKLGAPLLLYLYYALDNRPFWFRALWRITDLGRLLVSRCPHSLRYALSQAIAVAVYLPLARCWRLLESFGVNVSGFPLAFYRSQSFYTMRTDALDRFGTRLEQRFTAKQIEQMMISAGLERIRFSNETPYWCAVGYRA